MVRIDVPLVRLPAALDGFTIAQLSDFHYDEEFTIVPIRKAIEMVNGLRPDLIALTGDYADYDACIDWIPDTLGRLSAR